MVIRCRPRLLRAGDLQAVELGQHAQSLELTDVHVEGRGGDVLEDDAVEAVGDLVVAACGVLGQQRDRLRRAVTAE